MRASLVCHPALQELKVRILARAIPAPRLRPSSNLLHPQSSGILHDLDVERTSGHLSHNCLYNGTNFLVPISKLCFTFIHLHIRGVYWVVVSQWLRSIGGVLEVAWVLGRSWLTIVVLAILACLTESTAISNHLKIPCQQLLLVSIIWSVHHGPKLGDCCGCYGSMRGWPIKARDFPGCLPSLI